MVRPPFASLELRDASVGRWLTHAFGLELDLGVAVPALPRSDALAGKRAPTVVDLVYARSLRRYWPAREARRTGVMGPVAKPVMTVDEHPTAGYLIRLPPYGQYLVAADGLSIACAPPSVGWWYWQRVLIGQVLPAAAALGGYEVLHASAVRLNGRAVAFAGPTGVGKSSLALRMALRGATLLAEDVVVLGDSGESGILVEPGTGMLNLRDAEAALLSSEDIARLGTVVGRSHGKLHLIANRDDRSTPLAAFYVLERALGGEVIESVDNAGATVLFPHTFVSYVYRPERLVRQLEIAARVSRTVKVFKLRILPGWTAERLAAAVVEHVADVTSTP